jgi:hypothetical protein
MIISDITWWRDIIIFPFVVNIACTLLLIWTDRLFRSKLAFSTPNIERIWLWGKPIIYALLLIASILFSAYSEPPWKTTLTWLCITLSLVFIGLLQWPVIKFAQTGIVGVDKHISKGLDYKKSLKLCKHDLFFLGVGATKLLNEKQEFEEAIRRCSSPANPVRFLLSNPQNPILTLAANRAGVTATEFSDKVQKSIDEIKELRDKKGLNIQIKLYDASSEQQMPKFRLLFLNGDICLMSYTIFGESIETTLPQYWVKQWKGKGDKYSLYYPLHMYFEQLWTSAIEI